MSIVLVAKGRIDLSLNTKLKTLGFTGAGWTGDLDADKKKIMVSRRIVFPWEGLVKQLREAFPLDFYFEREGKKITDEEAYV